MSSILSLCSTTRHHAMLLRPFPFYHDTTARPPLRRVPSSPDPGRAFCLEFYKMRNALMAMRGFCASVRPSTLPSTLG